MTNERGHTLRSVLFVSSHEGPDVEEHLARVRRADLLPVQAASVDAALELLTQFSVSAVLYLAPTDPAALQDGCVRLAAGGMPIVALAADDLPAAVEEALAGQGVAILRRPFAPAPLSAAVRKQEQRLVG